MDIKQINKKILFTRRAVHEYRLKLQNNKKPPRGGKINNERNNNMSNNKQNPQQPQPIRKPLNEDGVSKPSHPAPSKPPISPPPKKQ